MPCIIFYDLIFKNKLIRYIVALFIIIAFFRFFDAKSGHSQFCNSSLLSFLELLFSLLLSFEVYSVQYGTI